MSMSVRRSIAAIAGLGMLVLVPGISAPSAADPKPPLPPGHGHGNGHGKGDLALGKHDTALLSKAQAKGERTVELLVITEPGRGKQVSADVRKLGGTVRFSKDEVNYLRVEVPVSRAGDVAGLGDVSAVDVDELIPIEETVPEPAGQLAPLPQPAPGTVTPAENPYLATQDVGIPQFTGAHPTWDGRGTRIAVIDTGIDLHHPALQTTSTGERKIVDWVTATDPSFVGDVNADDDPTWIHMATPVQADPSFGNGGAWTAPAPGTYRFGTFDERDPRLGGDLGNDVDRDGNPAGSTGIFGVLWDPQTGSVYVDLDQDHSFANEVAMTDYGVKHDIGWFGSDDPATAVRETVPFVVQTDAEHDAVNIGLASGPHGSEVAGVASGNDVFGGAADGAAPGSQLVSVRACLFDAGCTNHALIEGMIWAADQGNADIINMSIGATPALNDGNNARAELYDGLIDTYGVQIFLSAGNTGGGLNSIGDPAVATKAVAVGSYVSKETRLSNYGVAVAEDDNLHGFTSTGPREDGGFKPDVVAPGSAVSTTPTWIEGRPEPGTYPLPPGLAMAQGTSLAAPQVSGAAAVLVSAAKASQMSWNPAQLRLALRSGARFLDGYGAHEQGNGLVDIADAWKVLRKGPEPVAVSASVETHTVLSGFLRVPGVGTGIYDREGVAVGDTYTRTYAVTRTSGPAKAANYKISWVGNDGTFATSKKPVRLGRDQAVQVPVTVRVTAPGVHSAILNLDDPSTPGIDFQTLNTVVAPYEIDGTSSRQIDGTIERGQSQSYFFRVTPGTPTLSVDLAGPTGDAGTGQVRFLRYDPRGSLVDDNGDTACWVPAVEECKSGSPASRTIPDPMPGVWEVVVEARKSSDTMQAPFSLTVAKLGVTVDPDPDVIANATAGTPIDRTYTVTNPNGAFTGRALGGTLGSARRESPTIADGAQTQFQVSVPPGTSQLNATIGNPGDPGGDLDLSLYSCVTGTCVLARQSASTSATETVTVDNPAAGQWIVLVDGFSVPSGSMTYDYVDVLTNPAYGTITVNDVNALHPTGSSWQITGTVTAASAPPAGRVLQGSVRVETSNAVLVGSNDVVVEAVE